MLEIYLPTRTVPYNTVPILPAITCVAAVIMYCLSRRKNYSLTKKDKFIDYGNKLLFLTGLFFSLGIMMMFFKYGGLIGSTVVDKQKIVSEINHDYTIEFKKWNNKAKETFTGEISGASYECKINHVKTKIQNSYPYFITCNNNGVDFEPMKKVTNVTQ